MRKQVLLILIFLVSCSQMLEIGYDDGIIENRGMQDAATKSEIPDCLLNKDELLHMFQSSHISMLINGVIQKDSIYIQTLTDEDIVSLGITEKEMEFSSEYLRVLNKLL